MPLPAAPASVDFLIEDNSGCFQGSPWQAVMQFFTDDAGVTPYDFTDHEIDMHIREGVADSGATAVADLTTRSSSAQTPRIFFIGADSAGLPVIEGTPDPTNGFVLFKIPAAETALITPSKTIKKGKYPVVSRFDYDIEVTAAGGEPSRLAMGIWELSHEVTRR